MLQLGIFTFRDFNGRWYVGAEWHYDTDTDTPTRIVEVAEGTDTFEVESGFDQDGYDTEEAAIAAINAKEIK